MRTGTRTTIDVFRLARRQLVRMAEFSGKKMYREASDIIYTAFKASGLSLPREENAEPTGAGKSTD